jgi:hypothetical protein
MKQLVISHRNSFSYKLLVAKTVPGQVVENAGAFQEKDATFAFFA